MDAEVVLGPDEWFQKGPTSADAPKSEGQSRKRAIGQEPTIIDQGGDELSERWGDPFARLSQGGVNFFHELIEIARRIRGPMLDEEMIKKDINGNPAKTPPQWGEETGGGLENRVVIGETVDATVVHDSRDHLGRKLVLKARWSAANVVAKKGSEAGAFVVVREMKMGEEVQDLRARYVKDKEVSMIVSWNGKIVDGEEVFGLLNDPLVLRGEGVFETIRGEGERVYHFGAHYQRLARGAEILGLPCPEKAALEETMAGLLKKTGHPFSRIRITLGRNCLVTVEELVLRDGDWKVMTSAIPVNHRSPLAGVKCSSYAENVLILRNTPCDEVLRPDLDGNLSEGCLSNVFFIHEGQLCTPELSTGCLPGVMRGRIIEIAKVVEGKWPIAILKEASEIWLTNATRGILRVGEIDGREMPPACERLAEIRREIWGTGKP